MADGAVKARVEALDVLRGLAVLGMALSGMVPYRSLPAWMYHAQLPPPSRDFDPSIFGLTWVDTVFPMFLFAMGAAIPFSLGRRLEKGESNFELLKGLCGRGLLLAAYALIGQHLRPYVLADNPGIGEWVISLVGFVLIGVILLRKDAWPGWKWPYTAGAWIGAFLIIAFWNYPDDTRGFANYRNDVILMVLANVAVSGGAIWLWTRDRPMVRWTVVAALAAIFLAKDSPGLAKTIWDWDPTNYLSFKNGPYGRFLPIFYHFEYHKYLLLVLPATFVGDLMRGESSPAAALRWRPFLVASGPVSFAVACVGLTQRWTSGTTLLLAAIFSAVLVAARDAGAVLKVFRLGAALLAIGLLAEPIGGGIRKDPATLSYFFVTGGLCCALLGSFTLAAPRIQESRVWRSIRDTGVNPIVGYLTITNLVWGIVGITGLEVAVNDLTQNPWILLGWAFLKTVFVALVTAWFTRRHVFLRA